MLLGVLCALATAPDVEARPAKRPIALASLPLVSVALLPLDILRRVARDSAAHGAPVSCTDLRHCPDLDLWGRALDLDGDGTREWLVQDQGFSGTGAELDYVFRKDTTGHWKMVGRIEGLHLRTIGPGKTKGFLDLHGAIAGVCVEGRGKARWNGRAYVAHLGREKPRPC